MGWLQSSAILSLALLALAAAAPNTPAQSRSDPIATLARDRYKNGATTLRAFASVAEAMKYSVAKFDLNGNTVALGAVIDTNGLVITKASEIKSGKLTCWLANGSEVGAKLLAKDDENDVALVRIDALGLKPIAWATEPLRAGQWALTPGIRSELQAAGVVSVPRALHRRAFIGVVLDFRASQAKIARLMPGLGAEQAGLKPGDVVMAVDGKDISDSDDLVLALRNFHEEQTIQLRVRRDGEEFDASIKMMVPKTEVTATDPANPFSRLDRMNRLGGGVSGRAEGFQLAIQHDTVLAPWLCGGPLVNLDGKAIGLNIARAGRVASYALPPDLVRQIIDHLKQEARKTEESAKSEPTSQARESAQPQ